ncbi:MAG: TIGR04552 family protein [Proteobacteria bacterium]|jgi:uncharacterized protein (TIGR04552 family)|nr:TIGR04552 family protein [Pseudomonadota bacterium]
MPLRFKFDPNALNVVAGGQSTIDIPKLNFKTLDEVTAFIKSYGFDLKNENETEKLWYYHRRALVLLTEKLGFNLSEIPTVLADRKQLEDLRKLLLFASSSSPEETELQKWSCALLRTMHVFVHTENDLFASFSEEIQKQILSPFQASVYHDGTSGKTLLKRAQESEVTGDALPLLGFEVKPFKTSSSAVIKLLAKPDALAMNVFDKLGVRFITNNMFDTFRVIRFLVEENLISFPHIIPDQSSNNLYPVDLFMSACEKMESQKRLLSDEEVEIIFSQHLEENKDSASFLRKENFFSGSDYKFIKFICRKLIRIEQEKQGFTFFYPYEVQIMDQKNHQKILSGPSQHLAYKERQKQGARKRLFPLNADL